MSALPRRLSSSFASSLQKGFHDIELAISENAVAALLAAAILIGVLVAVALRASGGAQGGSAASRNRSYDLDLEPAHAEEYAKLQVRVRAHDQEAELEVETDGFESYEELRELIVDAVPSMFRDTDELSLEYMNQRNRWMRVKRSTPLETVKAAKMARITVIK